MDANYSQESIEEMIVRKHQTLLLTATEFDEIAEKYTIKTQQLLGAT